MLQHITRGYEILLRKKDKLPKLKSCLEKRAIGLWQIISVVIHVH